MHAVGWDTRNNGLDRSDIQWGHIPSWTSLAEIWQFLISHTTDCFFFYTPKHTWYLFELCFKSSNLYIEKRAAATVWLVSVTSSTDQRPLKINALELTQVFTIFAQDHWILLWISCDCLRANPNLELYYCCRLHSCTFFEAVHVYVWNQTKKYLQKWFHWN